MCASPILLIRISEIAIKSSRTRRRFTRLLIKHIKNILELLGYEDAQIIDSYSRIYVKGSNLSKVLELLSTIIPGISSISFAYEVKTDIKTIKQCIKDKFVNVLSKKENFAVRVKRTGAHDFTSMELAAELGEFVLKVSNNENLKVNLTNPQYTLYVEVRDKISYVFDNIIRGLGGLPACSQGRVLVIYSGLEEDIANIIQLYKRGAEVIPYAIVDDNSKMKIKKELEELSKFMRIQHYKDKESEPLKEISIFNLKENNEALKEGILNAYYKYKCMAIGTNQELFWKIQNEIPVSIPIFVPYLALKFDRKQLIKWKSVLNYYFSKKT
ncbi:MAG: THUMP domain-containing protein [Candidatus Heimdallarchaeaceae archaeon]